MYCPRWKAEQWSGEWQPEGAPEDDILSHDLAALLELLPRSRGGLAMLGSAAQGVWETTLGPCNAIAQPAMRRAQEAAWAAEELIHYVDARPCTDSH